MSTGPKYSEWEVSEIMRLARKGLTRKQIAQAIGRPYSGVVDRIRHLRIRVPRARRNIIRVGEDEIPILSYDTKDPRSYNCQKLEICSHSRCHLARENKCPAWLNYLNKPAEKLAS